MKATGARGEDAAAGYLESIGYEILHRNWRHRRLEVDIIARWGDALIFAEVKTRGSAQFGMPETFVDRRKQRCLMRAAEAYIRQSDHTGEARFDILAVRYRDDERSMEVRHFPDAWYAVSTHHGENPDSERNGGW